MDGGRARARPFLLQSPTRIVVADDNASLSLRPLSHGQNCTCIEVLFLLRMRMVEGRLSEETIARLDRDIFFRPYALLTSVEYTPARRLSDDSSYIPWLIVHQRIPMNTEPIVPRARPAGALRAQHALLLRLAFQTQAPI